MYWSTITNDPGFMLMFRDPTAEKEIILSTPEFFNASIFAL